MVGRIGAFSARWLARCVGVVCLQPSVEIIRLLKYLERSA